MIWIKKVQNQKPWCSEVVWVSEALMSQGSGARFRAPEALGYFIVKAAFCGFSEHLSAIFPLYNNTNYVYQKVFWIVDDKK